MRTFTQKLKAIQQTTSVKSTKSDRAPSRQSRDANAILHLQRTIGNQAVQRILQTHAEELKTGLPRTASPLFGHDISRIPIHPPAAGAIQTKLTINKPGDEYEQEADRISEQVMRMPEPQLQRACSYDGGCPRCKIEQESHEQLQTKRVPAHETAETMPPIVRDVFSSPGQPLESTTREFMESRFGHDFRKVRVHMDARSVESARAVGARAYTVAPRIVFGAGQYAPCKTEGRRLLAHELTHVVQQGRPSLNRSQREPFPSIQRQANQPANEEEQLIGPLTDQEWQLLELWQSLGEVGIDPLTDNPDHNELVVADAIFCSRFLRSLRFNNPGEDPLLCVISDVTRADPRVQQLAQHVAARGPIINWARVDPEQRMLYVMELLVNTYHFPENGAAGLVGNLWSESGVLPSRIEGSRPQTPMTAQNFAGQTTDFTAGQVMNRNPAAGQGPRRPGIGLAQWTSANRRAGLFQHIFQGRQQGAAILFNMDAQVDYLVTELQALYPHVNGVLIGAGVSLNDASDEVVYRFEVPGSVLDAQGHLLPRNDPAVQAVFASRRANSQRALQVFRAAHP